MDNDYFEPEFTINPKSFEPYLTTTHSLLLNIKNKSINKTLKNSYNYNSIKNTKINNNNDCKPPLPKNTFSKIKSPILLNNKEKANNIKSNSSVSDTDSEDSFEEKMKRVFDKVVNKKNTRELQNSKTNNIETNLKENTIKIQKDSKKTNTKLKKKIHKKKETKDYKNIVDDKSFKNMEISLNKEKLYLIDIINKLTKENKMIKQEIKNEIIKREDFINIVNKVLSLYKEGLTIN